MPDRDTIDRYPLGVLETGERYVGCLHLRQGVSFVRAARLWYELATFASQRFGAEVDVADAEVCREFDVGSCERIYDHPVISAMDTERRLKGER